MQYIRILSCLSSTFSYSSTHDNVDELYIVYQCARPIIFCRETYNREYISYDTLTLFIMIII